MTSNNLNPEPLQAIEVPAKEARAWDQLLQHCGKSSLQQAWGYGEALAVRKSAQVTRLTISSGEQKIAMVQALRTHDFGFGSINRIIRGPLWLEDVTSPLRHEIYQLIHRTLSPRLADVLFWLPELPDNAESKETMKAIGRRRMVTGYSTIWLDIRPDESQLLSGLHGKWRNGLRTAQNNNIKIRPVTRGQSFEDTMDAYDHFRRKQKFVGPPADLIRDIRASSPTRNESNPVRVLEAVHRKESIAGTVVVRHGSSATYLASWTNNEGRQLNAHNLLLWHAITTLRKTGTEWLDLGGVDTQSAPGLARFKLGLGGELYTQVGTYL